MRLIKIVFKFKNTKSNRSTVQSQTQNQGNESVIVWNRTEELMAWLSGELECGREQPTCERVIRPVQLPGVGQTLLLAPGLHPRLASSRGAPRVKKNKTNKQQQPNKKRPGARPRRDSSPNWDAHALFSPCRDAPQTSDCFVQGEERHACGRARARRESLR